MLASWREAGGDLPGWFKVALWAGLGLGLGLLAGHARAEAPKSIEFQVDRFVSQGASPLSGSQMEAVLLPYANQRYDLEGVQKVAAALEQAIREQGYAFYRVVVPPQTLSERQVVLQVIEFRVGEVSLQGNQYFEADNIRASLPGLESGTSPNTKQLADQLDVANRHPTKNLQLTFRQGQAPETLDALLDVRDASPLTLSLLANNTGSAATGRERLTASAQYANLWQRDHLATLSYTTSPGHWSDVQQYGGSYSAPLYAWQSWVTFYAASSSVDSGVVANDFKVTGSGQVYGLHYLQYLPGIGRYDQQLDLGLDNRFFNNDIDFLGQPIGVDIRSVPVSLQYRGTYQWPQTRLGGHLLWAANTGWGSKNDDASYGASRVGAKDNWNALRYGFDLGHSLDDWQLALRFAGQWSTQPLISGEQFGLGGVSSVRGYEEREVSVDSGEVYNLELISPPWNGVKGLLFMDYGHGRLQQAQAGENAEDEIKGSGAGLRGQWPFIAVSLDLAYAWDETANTDNGDIFVHVAIGLTY